ncbi:putative terpene synthase 9 [Quercus suber]|uniref:Terpene synthase 9 n=1 Tax=Quercus suber TaxID=58331 RepID=A0AAW0L851_QUESU
MELIISYSSPSCLTTSTLYYHRNTLVLARKQCKRCKKGQSVLPSFMIISKFSDKQVIPRRSANYRPSIWDQKLIESLSTPYSVSPVIITLLFPIYYHTLTIRLYCMVVLQYEFHATRLEGLKQDVKNLLTSTKDPSVLMKLIDSMQRLGVDYHFEKEIEEVLGIQHPDVTSDLYTTALHFRILRERGFPISPDVFDKFRSSDGRFMDSLSRDVNGLLSLYEATHLGMHRENILEEARDFSMKNLDSLMKVLDNYSAKKVKQSLEMPLYWRIPRVEALNFIDVYQKDKNLKFSRDRLVENYLWAMGTISEPHLSKCRIGLTKYVCIITAIDDMYDVYGLVDELECFTASVNRYKINMNIKDTIFLLSCPNHLDDKFYSFLSCPFLIF